MCAFKKGSSPYQRYQPNMQYSPQVRFPLLVLTNPMIWCFIFKGGYSPPYEEHPGNVNSQRDFFLHFFYP
jgi:hypothetical protein